MRSRLREYTFEVFKTPLKIGEIKGKIVIIYNPLEFPLFRKSRVSAP